MNELSLFTGAGGGVLGTKLLGWRCIGYVEWEPYCQAVIAQRIADGILEEAPIFGDIRQFVKSGASRAYRGFADVVSAGFPCQPHSVAGKQLGADDPRDMWPATADTIRDVEPGAALLENVAGLVDSGYIGRVLADLALLGFDAEWGVFRADEEGAPHVRQRVFILATNADQLRSQGEWPAEIGTWRQQQFEGLVQDSIRLGVPTNTRSGVSDGVAHRSHRLKASGNGQVPAVVVRACSELAIQGGLT